MDTPRHEGGPVEDLPEKIDHEEEYLTPENADEQFDKALEDPELHKFLKSLEDHQEMMENPQGDMAGIPFDPMNVFESLDFFFDTTGATMADFCKFGGISKGRLKLLMKGRRNPTDQDCDQAMLAVETIMKKAEKDSRYKDKLVKALARNIKYHGKMPHTPDIPLMGIEGT